MLNGRTPMWDQTSKSSQVMEPARGAWMDSSGSIGTASVPNAGRPFRLCLGQPGLDVESVKS